MHPDRRIATSWLASVALLLMLAPAASAVPVVYYTVDALGGGIFQYNLTIDNDGGSEALSGLNILFGNSVFGLDDTSVIGAPEDVGGNPDADWNFFAPFPPFLDDLDYFSLDPAGDVAVGGVLGDFFFWSATNPSSIGGDDFAVEGIGADSGAQIPLGNAHAIPEPSTLLLVASGLAGLYGARRGRKPR
ncbi:MAG: PEP-CTERM sorting domain-containing protein [Candidatus Binatia bacterium]